MFLQLNINKSPEKGWLIFDAKTGCWVCQDWRNIRIDKVTDTPSLIVDTENLIDYRVGIDGIQKHIDDCLAYYSKLLEKKCCNSVGVSSKSIESLESIQKQSASCDEDEFIEQGMVVKTIKSVRNFQNKPVQEIWHNDGDQVLAFSRGDLVFVFNFSPSRSFTDYGFLVPTGSYEVVLNTDAKEFGGNGLADDSIIHLTNYDPMYVKDHKEWLKLYLPARSAVVLKKN